MKQHIVLKSSCGFDSVEEKLPYKRKYKFVLYLVISRVFFYTDLLNDRYEFTTLLVSF